MTKFGIGQAVRRVEDQRFTTGTGRYVCDIVLPRQCYGALVLSPHAHAIIRKIDITKAKAAPGVVCILTGADCDADKIGGIPPFFMPEHWGGPKGFGTKRPILVIDRVRCVGERLVGFLFVADIGVISDVAWRAGKDERRPRAQGLIHIRDRGKAIPCHADQFGGVTGLQSRVGDHHGDDVADVMRLVHGHHRIRLERRIRLVGIGDRSKARQAAEVGEIAGDVHRVNPRGRARRFDIALKADLRRHLRSESWIGLGPA